MDLITRDKTIVSQTYFNSWNDEKCWNKNYTIVTEISETASTLQARPVWRVHLRGKGIPLRRHFERKAKSASFSVTKCTCSEMSSRRHLQSRAGREINSGIFCTRIRVNYFSSLGSCHFSHVGSVRKYVHRGPVSLPDISPFYLHSTSSMGTKEYQSIEKEKQPVVFPRKPP